MSGRILIVEHDPVIAADLYIQTEDLGYDVGEPVASVGEALAEVEAGGVRAALLDCQLVGETSLAVAERLAASDTPFAYVTALDGFPADRAAWPEAPVLGKPLGGRDLERVLEGFGRAPTP